MDRRAFLKLLSISGLGSVAAGCGILRIDPMHVLIRSDVIDSLDKEREIMSRARLEWTEDGMVRVLYVQGTPYERGYQHGKLLQREIQDNLGYMYRKALDKFRSKELFAEAYERLSPYLPAEYVEEMHGLAHGSRLPLEVIHYVHALPSIAEWGGKSRLKSVVKQMMEGELATSCSNVGAKSASTADGKMYALRVLDWGLHRISKMHQYPLLTVGRPQTGNAYLNIGWAGFIGAVSGMNDKGITLGEMGYGSPPNETLRGRPMVFLLRDVLSKAGSLRDVRKVLKESPGENSYVFLMSDGKTGEAELYIKDHDRFEVHQPGEELKDKNEFVPAIKNVTYGGRYNDRMHTLLDQYYGQISPQLLIEKVIPQIAMASNFQNVIYNPADLQIWVSNAASKSERAAEQPYTFFDLKKALASFH